MPKRKERAARYIRESDERLVAGTTTMESATKLVKDHCERQYYIYEPEHEWREAISSVEVPYMERPALLDMLAAAKRHEFDVLVVPEIRALSRRQVEVLVIYDILQKYGVRLETVKEKFGEDAMSKAILSLRAMFVEIEVEQSKMRMMRGRADRIAIGQAPNCHPFAAYGYSFINTEKEVKGAYIFDHTIIYTDDAGNQWSPHKVICFIFKSFQSGESIKKICRILNDLKIPPPRPPKKRKQEEAFWQSGTVFGMLKNPIYCGELYTNKYTKKKGATGKKVTVFRPREEWIRLPDAPAIMTKEEWDAIQTQMTANKEESLRNNKHAMEDIGLLRAGYAICGICGCKLRTAPPPRKHSGIGLYACQNAVEDTSMKQRHRVQMSILSVDKEVRILIRELLQDPHWIREHVATLREENKKDEPVISKEDIQATIDGIKQSIRRLYKLAEYATDDDTIAELAEQMNGLEKRKRSAEYLLYDMDGDQEKETALEEEIQRFEKWAEAVRPNLTDPTYEPTYQELRLAIRILGIRAIIYPTQGDWPFRCDVVATVPEIAKKLNCFMDSGSAMPTSSEAKRIRRRTIYKGSSPAASIRPSQYKLASGSEPRRDLCNAEMIS
jgi:DNA invertase Pin-like site-specific DNA recombinase